MQPTKGPLDLSDNAIDLYIVNSASIVYFKDGALFNLLQVVALDSTYKPTSKKY